MRVAVVGTGGLGGYFGGRLAQAKVNVQFLARGRHLEAIRAGGLRVASVLGDFELTPAEAPATDDPATIGPVDVILFTVKSDDTDEAAAMIAPLIGPETAVISLQNGIDNEERIATRLGADHVAGGVAYIFAGIVQAGVVRHTAGQEEELVLGEVGDRARRQAPRAARSRERQSATPGFQQVSRTDPRTPTVLNRE